jgi:hypothetical protein
VDAAASGAKRRGQGVSPDDDAFLVQRARRKPEQREATEQALTYHAAAYGKSVWSRRPSLAIARRALFLQPEDGAQRERGDRPQGRSPGRARHKPLKPLRAERRVKPVRPW